MIRLVDLPSTDRRDGIASAPTEQAVARLADLASTANAGALRMAPTRSMTPPLGTAAHLLAAAVDDVELVVLESCHSTWLFDQDGHRFCRVLKGVREAPSVATQWRPYDHLLLHGDSDAFVVFLDSSGTRLLRSWRHTAHCEQCGGGVTAGRSLADLRRVARA